MEDLGDQRPHGLSAGRPGDQHLENHNIVSDGTVDGSIQVPGIGAPIVLMADRGTSADIRRSRP